MERRGYWVSNTESVSRAEQGLGSEGLRVRRVFRKKLRLWPQVEVKV